MLTEDEYYLRFKEYDRDKLFDIIKNRDNYQEKALKATLRLIEEKGLKEDLSELLDSLDAEKERIEDEAFSEIVVNGAFFSKAVKFKNENNYIHIRTSEILKLEAALSEADVDYFSEDKNIDAFMSLHPTHRYYFLTKDLKKVDEIMQELGLTDPQQDVKPFIKFRFKTMAIIVFAIIIVLLVINSLGV
ncbi:MAG: hypothetical protein AAF551_07150 [Bacteroidota bacterium]